MTAARIGRERLTWISPEFFFGTGVIALYRDVDDLLERGDEPNQAHSRHVWTSLCLLPQPLLQR
jgi:hypothetical protein